jgi:hypothetical protein
MLEQAVDPQEVQKYSAAVRDKIGSGEMGDAVGQAAQTLNRQGDPAALLQSALPDVKPEVASSGGQHLESTPFMSRAPLQSLVQSTVEEKLREQGATGPAAGRPGLLSRIIERIQQLLHPVRYGPDDSHWVTVIGEAALERLAKGNHPFNPQPGHAEISDDARIVIVGDWGTGLPRAREVAKYMAAEVSEALAQGRQAHVIHLGDVYYSGLPEEVKRNVLAPGMWPVSPEQAAGGVTSWSLNGNHDMYGGGFGYFQTLLGDPRFAKQRSPDGRPTSFFRISSPSWDFVGLDTSWDTDVLSQGQSAVLADPQASFVADIARQSSRKLCLLSHHQLVSAYSTRDIGTILPMKLRPVLDSGRINAWIWGHEHRCMGFAGVPGVGYARCIGHGGVPVPMTHGQNDPVPPPGMWEERESIEIDGTPWMRFGFAVLDLHGDEIDVRYRIETGATTRLEQFG